MSYLRTTLAEHPELKPQILALKDEALTASWRRNVSVSRPFVECVMDCFPQYQCIVCNTERQVVAFGLSTPFTWNGTIQDLPEGIKHALGPLHWRFSAAPSSRSGQPTDTGFAPGSQRSRLIEASCPCASLSQISLSTDTDRRIRVLDTRGWLAF